MRAFAVACIVTTACSGASTNDDGGTATDAAADAAPDSVTDSAPVSDSASDSAPDSAIDGGPKTYTTKFPLTENPLSESSNWINGKTTGIDWADVQTSTHLAYGTVVSLGPPYNDTTAVLVGAWSSSQSACATVHTVNQTGNAYEEVELRLRTTITANSITGYEFNFRCTHDGSQYAQIVRWNGALNSFAYVNAATGPGLHDGDVVCATASGSTLTATINSVQVVQGTDATFASGSPGIGFYMQGGTTNQLADYGFSEFTATEN